MTRRWISCLSCLGVFVIGIVIGALGVGVWLMRPWPPGDLDIHTGLAYGDDPQQRLDIIAPRTAGIHFAIIMVHGGAWRLGSRRDNNDMAFFFARQGFVVANVDYRLVDGKRNVFPAAVDDVQQSVRWVRAHAGQYHLCPYPLGGLGGSAGGHLVAMLGTCDTLHDTVPSLSSYSSRLQAVVDISGPTDLTADFTGYAAGPFSSTRLVSDFMGGEREGEPAAYREASPMFHIDEKTARFLICHGDADTVVPVDQSKKFYELLRAKNINAQLIIFPHQGHAFDSISAIKFLLAANDFFQASLKTSP